MLVEAVVMVELENRMGIPGNGLSVMSTWHYSLARGMGGRRGEPWEGMDRLG